MTTKRSNNNTKINNKNGSKKRVVDDYYKLKTMVVVAALLAVVSSSSSFSVSAFAPTRITRTMRTTTATTTIREMRTVVATKRNNNNYRNVGAATTSSSLSSTTTTEEDTIIDATTTKSESSESTTAKKKVKYERVLSGVQPTGSLHLGNYLGAIRQWVDFQNNPNQILLQNQNNQNDDEKKEEEQEQVEIEVENFFCVVDLHAITMPHDPKQLKESTLSSAALYIAAGIDPMKSKIFVQSHVSAHSELAWLLNCITPMNWLEKMIQYKEKSAKNKKQQGDEGGGVGVGLFTYPVLMAADIMLYKSTMVPVGEDQRQHLELTRDIVRRFNDLFCKGNQYKKRCKAAGVKNTRPVFVEPDAYIMKEGARVMSLTDGTSKMSKSDPDDNSRINVLDDPKMIRSKIKRCKTDSYDGIEWDNPDRPESTNLLNIYSAVQPTRKSKKEILDEVGHMTWGEFKPVLADAIIDHLKPIQDKYYEVRQDPEKLEEILRDGSFAANDVASQTLFQAKVAMGFDIPPSSQS